MKREPDYVFNIYRGGRHNRRGSRHTSKFDAKTGRLATGDAIYQINVYLKQPIVFGQFAEYL